MACTMSTCYSTHALINTVSGRSVEAVPQGPLKLDHWRAHVASLQVRPLKPEIHGSVPEGSE